MRRAGLAVLPLAFGLSGCVWLGSWTVEDTPGAFYTDDRSEVQVVSTMAGGKNFFVPSTIVVTAGTGRRLSVFNTTDIPHGFAIPGLGIELVIQPGVETPVELPQLEGGHVWAVNCHVHPAHRSATLLVLPSQP
jgi:hypothetical protein